VTLPEEAGPRFIDMEKIFFGQKDGRNRTVGRMPSARKSKGEHSMPRVLCKLTKSGYKNNINIEYCRAEGTLAN
jgi:hypothetical protein